MPVDRFLERTAKNENDEDEWHAEQNDAPFGDTTSHADTRGQPDTGCGGHPRSRAQTFLARHVIKLDACRIAAHTL
jgi:hypothetical protein